TATGSSSVPSTSRTRPNCGSSVSPPPLGRPSGQATRSPCSSRELGLELRPRAFLVAVALLRERLRVNVVPPHLPEPTRVLRAELEASQPLGALPRVALRNDQSQRPPVLGRQILAVVPPRDQHVVVIHRSKREVRGV